MSSNWFDSTSHQRCLKLDEVLYRVKREVCPGKSGQTHKGQPEWAQWKHPPPGQEQSSTSFLKTGRLAGYSVRLKRLLRS